MDAKETLETKGEESQEEEEEGSDDDDVYDEDDDDDEDGDNYFLLEKEKTVLEKIKRNRMRGSKLHVATELVIKHIDDEDGPKRADDATPSTRSSIDHTVPPPSSEERERSNTLLQLAKSKTANVINWKSKKGKGDLGDDTADTILSSREKAFIAPSPSHSPPASPLSRDLLVVEDDTHRIAAHKLRRDTGLFLAKPVSTAPVAPSSSPSFTKSKVPSSPRTLEESPDREKDEGSKSDRSLSENTSEDLKERKSDECKGDNFTACKPSKIRHRVR
jgi:hypothetical protein